MPIEGGFVGMVDREQFDEWLRERAAACRRGAPHRHASSASSATTTASAVVHYLRARSAARAQACRRRCARVPSSVPTARAPRWRSQAVPGAERTQVRLRLSRDRAHAAASTPAGYDGTRCDVYYRGALSPDFYGWVFPHGDTMSIGTGSADKGFSLRAAVGDAARAAAAWPAARRCAAKARRSR